MIVEAAMAVLFNEHVDNEQFSFFVELTEAFSDSGLAFANRFDLGARQFYSSNVGVQNFIFVSSLLILDVNVLLHGAKLIKLSAARDQFNPFQSILMYPGSLNPSYRESPLRPESASNMRTRLLRSSDLRVPIDSTPI